MTYKDSLLLSWKNVKSNKLRTAITIIIMALGIFALILIITAIKAASNSLSDSFSTMGANSFGIRYKDRNIRFGGGRGGNAEVVKKNTRKEKKSSLGKIISYDEAKEFKNRYSFPGTKVGLAIRGKSAVVVNTNKKKTNPDVNVFGGDENYLELNGYNIRYGRNFTQTEVESGRNLCIIGSGVAAKLFPDNAEKALDAVINVDQTPYRVIAVLEEKTSSAFFNSSRVVLTSVNNIRRLYAGASSTYTVAVKVNDLKLMDMASAEATGVFRPIRKLDVKEEDNFFIDKSDSIAQTLLTNLSFLEKGTIGIAFITLIGAAIGLMNIMLVAVNERTKEIGLAKALGCTSTNIRYQFLFESVIISLLGAVAGIVAGVLIGNVVAILLGTGFVVPWAWVIAAVIVCSLVGLGAGLYPAYKASKLDPIVALRHA
jgi:putative ABC transport system permease protein